ncbi:MAG TPA: JDVT-CTERM system glutamic-type intramembrane protease [Noviherbaspirillum sp.]|jgi:membrane protease YdiL (CAAX protease family)|uniref:JDVT-CTERM system glutamic-type intramembrane protease MrtJ n=1 Tax=Noviherbaspirillum sp. TaxID=1926288 RepID=UPI002F937DDF
MAQASGSQAVRARWRDELGLHCRAGFLRSPSYLCALAAGPAFLLLLDAGWPGLRAGAPAAPLAVLSLVLWQPIIEELLFRGVVQGQLLSTAHGRREAAGLSVANALSSLLFMGAHLIHHPPAWAAAILVPSLVFGYFREREGSLLPPLLLHVSYNACYFLWPL